MSAAMECTVTFPVVNRMFGVDHLAKRLNALVRDGQISDWHPGRWIDGNHTAIPITFDSIEDATLAKTLYLEHPAESPSPRLEARRDRRERANSAAG